jgi:hypothetical protein
MEFRTTFPIPPYPEKLVYGKPVFSMGSCFSGLLESKLSEGKFEVMSNPFGIIYNPVSILRLLTACLRGEGLDPEGVLTYQGRYFHYDLHSSVHASSVHKLIRNFEEISSSVVKVLSSCSHVIFTWGTSFIHEHRDRNVMVANCHKQPAFLFKKKLLPVSEMMDAFTDFMDLLRPINPAARVVVTVSPVRHTKDGIPANQLSKSLLRVFCHELTCKGMPVDYFPSYECLMDDLRDYRFYGQDMIHPSETAENYIWGLFIKAFMEPSVARTYEEVVKVKRSMAHRPFLQDSDEHRRFLKVLIGKMEKFEPPLDFSQEISILKQRLGGME